MVITPLNIIDIFSFEDNRHFFFWENVCMNSIYSLNFVSKIPLYLTIEAILKLYEKGGKEKCSSFMHFCVCNQIL